MESFEHIINMRLKVFYARLLFVVYIFVPDTFSVVGVQIRLLL